MHHVLFSSEWWEYFHPEKHFFSPRHHSRSASFCAEYKRKIFVQRQQHIIKVTVFWPCYSAQLCSCNNRSRFTMWIRFSCAVNEYSLCQIKPTCRTECEIQCKGQQSRCCLFKLLPPHNTGMIYWCWSASLIDDGLLFELLPVIGEVASGERCIDLCITLHYPRGTSDWFVYMFIFLFIGPTHNISECWENYEDTKLYSM